MSTRWMVGMAGLLNCLLVAPATAQQGGQTEPPKAAESKPSTAKPAVEQEVTGDSPAKKQQKSKGIHEKFLLDSYGKPVTIHEELVDSKGKRIPYTDIPLSKTFLCYPPPEGAPIAERPVKGVPKGYVCSPTQSDPNQVLRILYLSCPPPYHSCYIPNTPGRMGCCL